MWQILRAHQVDVDENQVTMLVALGRPQDAKSAEILLNTAGALGCAGMRPSAASKNFEIGSVLLEIAHAALQEASTQAKQQGEQNKQLVVALETASEALNSLVDVYTEDNVHSDAIRKMQLLEKMHPCVSQMEMLLRKFGRSLEPMLAERVEEVAANTAAFVDYKKDHI